MQQVAGEGERRVLQRAAGEGGRWSVGEATSEQRVRDEARYTQGGSLLNVRVAAFARLSCLDDRA
jgi:hypothetical protein